MKRHGMFSALLVAGTLIVAGCTSDATAPVARTAPVRPSGSVIGVAPGQYVVLFKANGVPADFAARIAALGGSVQFAHAGVGFALVNGLSDAGAGQIGSLSTVSEVRADEEVTLDQPHAPVLATVGDVAQSQGNPALAGRYSWQWNMRLIHADQAWAAGKLGSPGVTVAILDTGIDYDAPDLAGLVDLSRSISLSSFDNSIAATYFPTRNPISDFNGHGTNVATQVSSKAFALAGVTSRTTLIGVKVLDADGVGSLGTVLAGVLWAADHGADVANLSLGGGFSRRGNHQLVNLINRTFNYAKRQGMLVVVSAGNESEDLDHNGNVFNTYCDAAHVVCVSAVGPATATGSADAPAFYTNFGRKAIDVAGPGGNADAANGFGYSAWPWGIDVASWVWSYCSKTVIAALDASGAPILTGCVAGNRLTGYIGTSQAAPHVSGLAALLIAEEGGGRPNHIKKLIEKSSLDLGPRNRDAFYGHGRIDVMSALNRHGHEDD